MMSASEALAAVESRIREQASVAPVASMEWRAHMADLMHVTAVRREIESEARS